MCMLLLFSFLAVVDVATFCNVISKHLEAKFIHIAVQCSCEVAYHIFWVDSDSYRIKMGYDILGGEVRFGRMTHPNST